MAKASRKRLVYLCDWLPPDFGAVGQYAMGFARERARLGEDVVLGGLSSRADSVETETVGAGTLTVVRIHRQTYDRSDFKRRALWTLQTDLTLLARLGVELLRADEVLITGSPPFLVHLLAPLKSLAPGKRLTYRITDFHPECLMAEMDRPPFALRAFYRLTVFWRRRVDRFEALGEDQVRRLVDIGIRRDAIELKRDPSPVEITGTESPLPRPAELTGHVILMYSGNWGVAHDVDTFLEGYRKHHQQGSGRVALWLNATGAKADRVEAALREAGLPVHRGKPVPLEDLARLLVTPDAHLITLLDPFVGFVLPSKVYGCVASGKPVLFIGSEASDVHLLCSSQMDERPYFRVPTGDADGVAAALEQLGETMLRPD